MVVVVVGGVVLVVAAGAVAVVVLVAFSGTSVVDVGAVVEVVLVVAASIAGALDSSKSPTIRPAITSRAMSTPSAASPPQPHHRQPIFDLGAAGAPSNGGGGSAGRSPRAAGQETSAEAG